MPAQGLSCMPPKPGACPAAPTWELPRSALSCLTAGGCLPAGSDPFSGLMPATGNPAALPCLCALAECRRAALVYTRQSGRSEVGLCPGPFGPKTICKTCYVHWKKLNQVEKEEVQAEAAKQGLAKASSAGARL